MYKDGEEAPLTFVKERNGKYKYAPNTEEASATLVTDENGMIDVEGLDVGSYHFEETKAPEVQNTKITALPSTGGIGTTIFTIGGCAIMIVAAGLFFATRRKTQK